MIEEQGMFQREREIPSRESIVLTKETGARLFGRAYHALTETNSRFQRRPLGSGIKGPGYPWTEERDGFPKKIRAIQNFKSQHQSRAAEEQQRRGEPGGHCRRG